jgi:hypothetical protein
MKKLGLAGSSAVFTLCVSAALFAVTSVLLYSKLNGDYVHIPSGGLICKAKFETVQEMQVAKLALALGGGNDCQKVYSGYTAKVVKFVVSANPRVQAARQGLVAIEKDGELFYVLAKYKQSRK